MVWIWTRNTLLGELIGEAVQLRGLKFRHHNHPFAPPPAEAKSCSLLTVGPCVRDDEVFDWWQVKPPVLLLLRELGVDGGSKDEPCKDCIRLPLPLDIAEFHRCLDASIQSEAAD